MNKVSKQFYKEVHHLFPLLSNEERNFLDKLKEHLEIYELNYDNKSYEDYIEYFGDPKDIISTYYEHIESEYIVTHMKSRKIIKYLSITLICTFIFVSLVLVFFRYKEHQLNKDNQYFFTDVIEEVSDEEIEE